MSQNSDQHDAARERLSALMDGALDGTPAAQACSHWREDAESRRTWHVYHLIGDVLRSEDLATDPARDAVFLGAFRARLASEPVVLAPQPHAPAASAAPSFAPRRRARYWSWMAPTAVAAGFVAVAGVLALTGSPGAPSGNSVQQAAAPTAAPIAAPAIALAGAAAGASEPQTFVATGELIRDARLDRYLAAHKQFAGSSALGVPSAFLRNATAETAGR